MDEVRVGRVVGSTYAAVAQAAMRTRRAAIDTLIEKKKLPKTGWDDASIELMLHELALMDSNNYPGNVGLGEREGRIASDIVARMHYRLGHGVGRSGDIAAIQPKAAGSSLLARIAENMVKDVLRLTGLRRIKACIILPMATGMCLVMCMLTIRRMRPTARYVVWFRIDQKTCLKAIATAGYEPIVVDGVLEGDAIKTNMAKFKRVLEEHSADRIACVISTTTCFAPRELDDVGGIARACEEHGIPHVVNNAYGVQSTKCMHVINEAIRTGRVDAVVQSTDKNLMVPVGGGVIASPSKDFIADISKTYPGRASSTPVVDVFVTLLHMGEEEYMRRVRRRKELMRYLRERLSAVAEKHGERLLHVPGNPISCAMTLSATAERLRRAGHDVTFLGSMLFARRVSGSRVVSTTTTKEVADIKFQGYGAHIDQYPTPYMTAAAAIGLTQEEVDVFAEKLDAVLAKITKQAVERVVQHGGAGGGDGRQDELPKEDKGKAAECEQEAYAKDEMGTLRENGQGDASPSSTAASKTTADVVRL